MLKKKIQEKYEPKGESGDEDNNTNSNTNTSNTNSSSATTNQNFNDFSLPTGDLGLEGLKKRLQVRIILFES